MTNLWKRLSELGIRKDTPVLKARLIKMLNQIILAILIVQLYLVIESIFSDNLNNLLVDLFLLLGSTSILLLNHLNLFNLSKHVICLVYPILMILVTILYGETIRADYSYFIFMTLAFIFFQDYKVQFSFLAYYLSLYFFGLYYVDHYSPLLNYNNLNVDRSAVFIAAFFSLAIIIQMFKSSIKKQEKQTQELLDQLKEQNKKLNKVNQELEKFTYIASHDLKTPLRTISSFIGLMERKIQQEKYHQIPEYFEYVKTGAQQMHFLVTDILEYSKLSQTNNIHTEVKLNEVITRVIGQLDSLVQEKSARFQIDPLPKIYANRVQMNILFQNLIENGLKYNDSLPAKIKISHNHKANNHVIRIIDNGIGIKEEYQEKIFEMFQRLHTYDKYQGTGIGLSVCKKIVEQMNGKIEVSSNEHGTTFSIRLPAQTTNYSLNGGE